MFCCLATVALLLVSSLALDAVPKPIGLKELHGFENPDQELGPQLEGLGQGPQFENLGLDLQPEGHAQKILPEEQLPLGENCIPKDENCDPLSDNCCSGMTCAPSLVTHRLVCQESTPVGEGGGLKPVCIVEGAPCRPRSLDIGSLMDWQMRRRHNINHRLEWQGILQGRSGTPCCTYGLIQAIGEPFQVGSINLTSNGVIGVRTGAENTLQNSGPDAPTDYSVGIPS